MKNSIYYGPNEKEKYRNDFLSFARSYLSLSLCVCISMKR